MRYPSIIVGLTLSLSACVSPGPARGTAAWDVITSQQIAESRENTAFDAIRRLQPRWVTDGLSVYVDGALAAGGREGARADEGANLLRNLGASSIHELRFLDEQRAAIQYGMGMGPVILVITARQ